MRGLTWLSSGHSWEGLTGRLAWAALLVVFGGGQAIVWGHLWSRDLVGWAGVAETPLLDAWHPGRDLAWACALLAGLAVVALLLRRWAPGADPVLLLTFGALVVIGGLVLARLAPDLALHRQRVAFGALAGAHLKAGVIALGVLALTARLASPPALARLGRRKYVLLLGGVALIAITLALGVTLNARRLWLTVGSLAFQPVELLKLVVVVFLTFYLAEQAPALRMTVRHPFALPPLRLVGAGAVMVGLALSALVIQRDFGPVVQLYLVTLAMAYLATGSLSLVAVSLGGFLGAGGVAYAVGFPSIVRTRIDMWASPFDQSEGMVRALWAIASGGLWGKGLGAGHPELVPVVHSDYILAAVAEELGMVGVGAVLALYATLVLRGYVIAALQPALHGRLLAAGLTTLLGAQVLIVVGGNSGWLPVTGLTLPGLAHGGTSLVATAAIVGVLLRMSAVVGAPARAPGTAGQAAEVGRPARFV